MINVRLGVGCTMEFRRVFLAFLLAAALTLSSCSGLPQQGGGPVGGMTTLSLTMQADLLPNAVLPNAPPTGTSILSLKVTVLGVTLTPTSGNQVTLDLGTPSPVIELTRLQSDSSVLGTFSVTSGTYTSMTVVFASPDIVFLNQSGGTVTGTLSTCVDGAICEAQPPAAGAVQINFSPSLSLSANGQQGLRLAFNINNALNSTSTSIGMNFTPASLTVLSAATLPRTGTPSGALDLVEDFTGVVTSVTPSTRSVTVTSATRGTLTAVAPASFVLDDPFSVCTTTTPDFSCVKLNQVVSVDAMLNPDGTFTLQELEPLAATADDFIEGVVATVQDATHFQIVTTEKVTAPSTLLSSLSVGDPVSVTISAATNPFRVDTKGITVPANSFAGGTTTSVIFPGQTVSMHVTGFTAAAAGTFAAATIDGATLRFSRFTGTVAPPVTSPNFRITALPPMFALGNSSLPDPAQVQGTLNKTNYDGVADGTGLADGDTAATRALYLPPGASATFATAKVRKH